MNTAYLYDVTLFSTAALKEKFKVPTFVIGVKNYYSEIDMDNFLKKRPNLKRLDSLKPVPNPKYLEHKKDHMLQPAFLIWKD